MPPWGNLLQDARKVGEAVFEFTSMNRRYKPSGKETVALSLPSLNPARS